MSIAITHAKTSIPAVIAAGGCCRSPLVSNLVAATNSPLVPEGSEQLLVSYKATPHTPVDFARFAFDRFHNAPPQALREKYARYRYTTVGDYHRGKSYPQGNRRDHRAGEFDPKGKTVCAHGTNLTAVLKAELNGHAQLAGVFKQVKLQGKQPESGESAYFGTTLLNCRYVSVINLHGGKPQIEVAKKYAQDAATNFLTLPGNVFNAIPAIVIGEGVAALAYPLDTHIKSERAYKRVNIRLLALPNEQDKNLAMHWMGKARELSHFPHPDPIRFCTWQQLDACSSELGEPHNRHRFVDVQALWHLSQPLYHWEAPPRRSWLARIFCLA